MKPLVHRASPAALLAVAGCWVCGAGAAGAVALHTGSSGVDPKAPPVALVTGSDRGIGFALVQELATRGWRVVATCRNPGGAEALKSLAAAHPGVTIEALDVTDNTAIEALAAKYRSQPIDALINNAGIADNLVGMGKHPGGAGLGSLSPEEFAQVLRVNTYAPLKISAAFLEQVAASRQKKIVAITSGLGSLFYAAHLEGVTYYSISKAGLNMAMRILQGEVHERGVVVGLVAPGAVDTDMQRAYRAAAAQSGKPVTTPTLTPAESARSLVDYIETLGPEKSGRFYTSSGYEVPW